MVGAGVTASGQHTPRYRPWEVGIDDFSHIIISDYYLDDAHVTDEGEEVEEGWLDTVVEVATAARLTARGAAALEGHIGLVESKEESVVHIILGHAASHAQGGGRSWGQVTVIQPEQIFLDC